MSEKGIICYASPKGYGKTYYELEKLQQENIQLKERIEKAIESIEKQKIKMYKNRNKIALFVLMKLEKILKGDKE